MRRWAATNTTWRGRSNGNARRAGRSTYRKFRRHEHIGGYDDLAEHNAGTLKDRFERAGIVVLDEPPPPSNAAAATTAAAVPRSPSAPRSTR